MRFAASLAIAMTALPAIAATSPALAAPPAPPAAPAPVTVARYTFDAGVSATGRVAENSGRGTVLTVRTANQGRVTFTGTTADKDATFPAACAATVKAC